MTAPSFATLVVAGLSLLLLAETPLALQQPAAGRGGADPHGYFTRLTARPDVLASYSLRDPAQLAPRAKGGFAQSDSRTLRVTHAPSGDADPRRQDAAKVVIPAGTNSLPNQIRLPFNHGVAGFLITWDAYWGDEFQFARAGIENYKAFQLASGGRIWTEIRSRFGRAKAFRGAVALVDVRPYGAAAHKGSRLGKVNYGNGSLGGLRTHFAIAANKWTRYWVQLTPRGDGWWELSMWMADEDRDAVLLYEREPVRPKANGWDSFWLEFNTSTNKVLPDRGDLVAYVRNVVVLKAPTDLTPLLIRPSP